MKMKSVLTLSTLAAAALIFAGAQSAKAAEVTTDVTATTPVKEKIVHVKHKAKHASKEAKAKAETAKTDTDAKISTEIK